jgi:hypothetical protein
MVVTYEYQLIDALYHKLSAKIGMVAKGRAETYFVQE